MTPPFHIPEEILKDNISGATTRKPHRRLAILLYCFARRIKSYWAVPKEVRRTFLNDPRTRFATRTAVLDALDRYSKLHGGEKAANELSRLKTLSEGYDPVPVYKKILRHSGRRPSNIVRFIRESILHIDGDPAIMDDHVGVRAFIPLETALSGIGQCTGASSLAAALIETSGYNARLWGVPQHTFLEWQSRGGRWQLEDVDVLPPGTSLPRGLSMRSLLENYSDWRPVLDGLPTLNNIAPSSCFVPTDGGKLLVWRHYLPMPQRYLYQKEFDVGSVRRQIRNLKIEQTIKNRHAYISIQNLNSEGLLLVICNQAFANYQGMSLGDSGIQHDVFLFANAKGMYDSHMAQSQKKIFCHIPGSTECYEISLDGLDAKNVSVFILPTHNTNAEPYLIQHNIELNAPCGPIVSGVEKTCELTPFVAAGQAVFQELCEEAPHSISPSAISYAKGSMPGRAFGIIYHKDMPQFKGRVLDAACGTGEYSIALADQADSVAAIDYTDERIKFAETVLERLNPHPSIEPITGSIEDMPYVNDEFDAIFCRGAIFLTNLPNTLKEFYRVLKPGGHVYIDCNADAWNMFLIHERGKDNPDTLRQGRDTLYNTVWRRHIAESIPPLSKSIKKHGLRGVRNPHKAQLDPLLDEMDRHLRKMVSDDARQVRRLELEARHLCGEDHLAVILADMLAVAAGHQKGPSVTVGSQAWQPEEVADQLGLAGFENFQWWSEAGSRQALAKRPLEIGPQLDVDGTARLHYHGSLTVWHAVFEKPSL